MPERQCAADRLNLFVSRFHMPRISLNTLGCKLNFAETSTIAREFERHDFEVSKTLVADGRVQCGPMHTATVGLDGLAGAFAELASEPEQVKVLLDPRI